MIRRVALEKFLLAAFDAHEIRRLLRDLPGGASLEARLPGATASLAHLAGEAVGVLVRDGHLEDDALWDALIAERPRRRGEIEAIRDLREVDDDEPAPPPPPRPPPRPGGRRRILFVSASPERSRRLAVDQEFRRLRETLRASTERDRFDLEVEVAAGYDALEAALRRYRPHILHLSCHGDRAGNLHLADDRDGDAPELLPPEMFLDLLRLLARDLELVVVNACHSEVVAARIPPTVRQAIGMSDALADDAAIDFTRKLYENLADGEAVTHAFALACNKLRRYGAEATPQLFPR